VARGGRDCRGGAGGVGGGGGTPGVGMRGGEARGVVREGGPPVVAVVMAGRDQTSTTKSHSRSQFIPPIETFPVGFLVSADQRTIGCSLSLTIAFASLLYP